MDPNLLKSAFAIFIVFMVILAFILRRMAVDDIFSDDKATSFSDTAFKSNSMRDVLPTSMKESFSATTAREIGAGNTIEQSFFTKENINKVGKVLGAIGAVMIFAPLPDSLDGIGFGVAFLGYILANATKASTKKAKGTVSGGSLIQTLRKLASQPEYQEAMKLLTADMGNKKLLTSADRQQRAIRYLESKGVSTTEANRNVSVMASYITQQKQK